MGLILNLLQDLKTNQLCRTRFKEKILLFNFCQRSWRLCPNPNANYDFVLYNVHCTHSLLKLKDLFSLERDSQKGGQYFYCCITEIGQRQQNLPARVPDPGFGQICQQWTDLSVLRGHCMLSSLNGRGAGMLHPPVKQAAGMPRGRYDCPDHPYLLE